MDFSSVDLFAGFFHVGWWMGSASGGNEPSHEPTLVVGVMLNIIPNRGFIYPINLYWGWCKWSGMFYYWVYYGKPHQKSVDTQLILENPPLDIAKDLQAQAQLHINIYIIIYIYIFIYACTWYYFVVWKAWVWQLLAQCLISSGCGSPNFQRIPTAGLNPNAAEFRPNMWSCLAAGDGWWLFGKVGLFQKVLEENTQIQMVYHHFAFEK